MTKKQRIVNSFIRIKKPVTNLLRRKLTKFLNWKYLPWIVAFFVGLTVFFSLLQFRAFGWLLPLELGTYDQLLAAKSRQLKKVEDRIVMVLANDEDQRQWGWPLTDKQLILLIKNIITGNPNVIGLDLYRDLPVPLEGSEHYQELSELFRNTNNIFGIYKYVDSEGAHVDPPKVLQEQGQIGFNDLLPDSSGIIRRGLLYMGDEEGNVLEFFGLKLALHYLSQYGIEPQPDADNPNALRLGKALLVPLESDFGGYTNQESGGFQFMLDYSGGYSKLPTLNVTQVLTQQFDPQQLKDKIIIIGVNAEATPDFCYAPFNTAEGRRIPGALIHAYSVKQLIQMALGETEILRSWSEMQEILWIGFWSLLGAFICLWFRSLWYLTLILLLGLSSLGLISYWSFLHNTWVILTPTVGWLTSFLLMLAYLSYRERQQRAILMQLFSKHVSKEIAQEIWNRREQYLDAGRLVSQRVTATVLFTDLQNFTTISESLEPQTLMTWLNQYMEAMVEIVEKQHYGQVNKFMGDAIMAVFGVPIPSVTEQAIARDAINAVNCALAMRQEMERFHQFWQATGQPLVRMRIGIFTGTLVVGSLGSIERQEYAVLGDTVNIASRLESFDKDFDAENPCRILIGKSTLQYIGGDQFQTEYVGEVHVKGKKAQVTIYKVISSNKTVNNEN